MMYHLFRLPSASRLARPFYTPRRANGAVGCFLAAVYPQKGSQGQPMGLTFRPVSTFSNKSNSGSRNAAVVVVSAFACLGAALYAGHTRATKLYAFTDQQMDTVQPSASVSVTMEHAPLCDTIEFYGALDSKSADAEDLPVENAILTTAPAVPAPITRDYPVLLKVPLETITSLKQVTSMYKYEEWTFNGTTPGPFIRARVGDVVELALTNHDETGNPHNIDSHAFTGPGGGAAITTAEENETKTGRFKLLCPGLYIYHCAAAPVPVHIANGMFGLMDVEPAEGLPPADREYFGMQSEIYHEPPDVDDDGRRSSVVEFSYPNGLREEPNAVVFNGSESALTRDSPLKAEVGETVRIFFGNAGPNLTSAFHVIGSHFLNVYRDGDVVSPQDETSGPCLCHLEVFQSWI